MLFVFPLTYPCKISLPFSGCWHLRCQSESRSSVDFRTCHSSSWAQRGNHHNTLLWPQEPVRCGQPTALLQAQHRHPTLPTPTPGCHRVLQQCCQPWLPGQRGGHWGRASKAGPEVRLHSARYHSGPPQFHAENEKGSGAVVLWVAARVGGELERSCCLEAQVTWTLGVVWGLKFKWLVECFVSGRIKGCFRIVDLRKWFSDEDVKGDLVCSFVFLPTWYFHYVWCMLTCFGSYSDACMCVCMCTSMHGMCIGMCTRAHTHTHTHTQAYRSETENNNSHA